MTVNSQAVFLFPVCSWLDSGSAVSEVNMMFTFGIILTADWSIPEGDTDTTWYYITYLYVTEYYITL